MDGGEDAQHYGWRRECSKLWMEERTKKRMSSKSKEDNLVTTEYGREIGQNSGTQKTEMRILNYHSSSWGGSRKRSRFLASLQPLPRSSGIPPEWRPGRLRQSSNYDVNLCPLCGGHRQMRSPSLSAAALKFNRKGEKRGKVRARGYIFFFKSEILCTYSMCLKGLHHEL